MLICGIKASHDGAVAVIDGSQLLFSVEIEKLGNRRRYSSLDEIELVREVLATEGLALTDVDQFVVDGWYSSDGRSDVVVQTREGGKQLGIPTAPYIDPRGGAIGSYRNEFSGVGATALNAGYSSFSHDCGHVMASYCTSPFAAQRTAALVLSWDGGMLPRLYRVDPIAATIEPLGPLFPLVGNMFGNFCCQLEPFYRDPATMTERALTEFELSVPGQAMAYAALGTVQPDAFVAFDTLIDGYAPTIEMAELLGREVARRRRELFPGMTNADLIATFQAFIGHVLVEGIASALRQHSGGRAENLCLAGGCALNIKWNGLLRESGVVDQIWVPPFPNDAGAAIGTACAEMASRTGRFDLDWNVYRGPRLRDSPPPADWTARACDEHQLARHLHEDGEPVVVLDGRAELGPRALGNRSILAPATTLAAKDELNRIKKRQAYRPVAPICLESHAPEVFAPGGVDPYMVFEHRVASAWRDRVPAIVHLDGTARLQTLRADTPGTRTGRILHEYYKLSGVPVLCNTSANMKGYGFFADARDRCRVGP